jgi:hypothetical protein
MSDQRPPGEPGTDARPVRTNRRRVLAGFGAGAVAALAGCGSIGRNPSYEERTVGDVDGEPRTAEEMTAAEAVAQREVDEDLSPLSAITVEDHEFVFEDDYRGSTVQGTLENAGDARLQSVEVRVRVYDDADRHLGQYVASTTDLARGATWNFQVVLLVSPGDVAAYDLAAVGMSG